MAKDGKQADRLRPRPYRPDGAFGRDEPIPEFVRVSRAEQEQILERLTALEKRLAAIEDARRVETYRPPPVRATRRNEVRLTKRGGNQIWDASDLSPGYRAEVERHRGQYRDWLDGDPDDDAARAEYVGALRAGGWSESRIHRIKRDIARPWPDEEDGQ